ncbi:MAG: sugar phosphate isomerase/epimerase family protein [Eubacterium sp.]|nr:sugar phosphate isomerase/epimerase family protein [Eubacterium sp.]
MRYSMFSWFGYFMPFAERIQCIKDAGFEEVMISWEDECEPYALKKEKFPDIVRNMGLGITNIHAPFIGYNDIWEKTLKENEALLKTFVSFVSDCHRFDIPAVVVHTCDLDLGEHRWENGLAFFSELAEAGEKYGVDIAVENVSRQYLLKGLLDHIKTPHFGMCYDSSHDFMLPCGRGRILRAYGDRIKALHISDNDLHIDRHWIPGEGQIPFDEVLPEIAKLDLGYISYEVLANDAWKEKTPQEFCNRVRQWGLAKEILEA